MTHTAPPELPDLMVEHHAPARPSLRVGLVTETYPPEINGVALTLARLVREMQGLGHDIQLVRPRQAPDRHPLAGSGEMEHILVRGMPIPRYPHLRLGLPAKHALVSLWTQRRPDVVHIATEGPLGWSALQAARKLRLPVCSDFRTNFHAYSHHYRLGWLHKPIAAYLRKFHNHAHCTLVPTPALQDQLSQAGFERLQVVGRGVDVAAFHPRFRDNRLRASWGVGPDDPVALVVGRVATEKNLPLALEAWAAMKQVDARWRLVVVGDGPARPALMARHPDALWVGSQQGEALARHYASADVFLFPSQTETWGNVTAEALASGLAVVAFDHAAAAELIRHGHSGLLVLPHRPDAFVDSARSLALHPAEVQRLRQSAPGAVARRGWGEIARQVESVWAGMAREPERPAQASRGWRLDPA